MNEDQIFGYIERITFQNLENGFTVARLKIPRKKDLTTIVGHLPPLQPGEKVRCQGFWKNNPSHGLQFEVKACFLETPDDIIGIQKYLSSGLVQGIGSVYADRIVKKFGLKTLEVIEKTPYELLSIEGIGEKRLENIKTSWDAQKSVREIMIFLQKYEVSGAYAHKIYKSYGQEALDRLQQNPYDLAKDISGIGFKMADQIASKIGFQKESNQRIDAGIEYVLLELSLEGHVCYPLEPFFIKAQEILECELTLIKERIDHLVKEERIVQEFLPEKNELFLWLKKFFLTEKGIAFELKRLLEASSPLRTIDVEKAVDWVEKILHLELAPNQREAVKCSLEKKLHIITGGPGTGKSTITKAILAITSKLTSRILLAAPTGRAAKRMTEITKHQAFTIHSLLQYDFKEKGFRRNRENPLFCDFLIIDEASMIDTYLMYHLLKAIPTHARVLFVGDIHQLPSVGPGNVLKDLIESEKIPVSKLNKIFRQAAGSKIIINAHRINEGEFPFIDSDEKSDFFFIEAEEPQEVLSTIVSLVSTRLPKTYHFHPIDDIQVLTPMKRGTIGTQSLNIALQEKLNKPKDYLSYGGFLFSVGDKVMQIKNNYTKEVYNGDIGKILKIAKDEQEMLISYDGKIVPYSFQDLDEITLAYATSIHKYQGSESLCVVIPIHTSHFVMLHRNLLYTGVTRGKRLVVIVGNKKAIALAIKNDDVKKRFTSLQERIKSIVDS